MRAQRPPVPSPFVDLPVDHLLILPPSRATHNRIAAGLALADVETTQAVEETVNGALRIAVEGLDYKTLLEAVGANLSDADKRDTRIAVVPRWADDRARSRAFGAARPLAHLLEEYSASWICGVLQRGALQVHFQPLVQYPPGRVFGYECLLRGLSPDGRLIAPARLFGAAARLGMQYLLDHESARAAIAGAASLGFANAQYFINLMAGAVEDPGVAAESLLAAAKAGGLSPAQITFEIVDAESCTDRAHLLAIVRTFRDAGFRISLDDVGAGGASLLRLDELRPDYVKLDAAICRGALTGMLEAHLLRDLAKSARESGVVAVAKGLENADQLRFAIDAGVEVTQGFVHAQPAPTPLDSAAEDRVLEQIKCVAGADPAGTAASTELIESQPAPVQNGTLVNSQRL